MIGKTITHYRIVEKLGAGGMGVVYQAEDLDLQVTRALKFLPPLAAAGDQDRARLEREARAAASLEHPNICPVHEIGRAENQTFIVMSYLEGRTLGERLKSEGALSMDVALTIATQVGSALSRAHAAGVVHRDIKPANIMLTGESGGNQQATGGLQAVVMDFGLAQATDSTRVTKTGTTLGTAAYMSPEQARGQTVDGRTDVWSLGVVLYEMLTGQRPFSGDHLAAVAHAVQHDEPKPVTKQRPEVPADLERVIERSLAKDPEQRYQTADELLSDLQAVRDEQELGRKTAMHARRRQLKRRKRLLYGMLAAAVVIAVGFIWWSQYQDVRRIDALAVLPFANLSGDTEQEFFADGMTDALITELQQLAPDQLRVIGRTSVMSLKNSDKTLPEIAAALGVDAVVEASVIRSGNLVKVAAKLIKARPDEQQLWAETYERDLQDILALHAEVARRVAEQIQLVLSPETNVRLSGDKTVDPEAYESYLKGQHYLHNFKTIEELNLAGSFFTKSVQIDSTSAPAWAGLAEYHIQREHSGLGTDAIPQAEYAASRALELDDTLGQAHAAMAHILWEHQYRPREAEVAWQRSFACNPNDPWAQYVYSYYCMTLGRFAESAKAIRRAQELDPLSWWVNTNGFPILRYAKRYEEAERWIARTQETFPDWRGLAPLAWIYMDQKRYEECLVLFQSVKVEDRDLREHSAFLELLVHLDRQAEAAAYLERYRSLAESDSAFLDLGWDYACLGDLGTAQNWLDEAEKAGIETLLNLARLAVMVGDMDRAFGYLERAYQDRSFHLTRLATFAETFSSFRPIADDPRYHDLVRRMGLRD